MKRNFFKIITMVFFLLYGTTLWANNTLQYSISKEKIEDARFFDYEDGTYTVIIKLKGPYKEEFAKLTGKNIGKKLQIIFQEQILIEPIIRGQIDSGMINVSEWKSKEDAQRFIDTLLH